VGGDDELGSLLKQKMNGRKSGLDPGVIPDAAAIVQGNVEVNPEKDSFSFAV